MTQFDAIIIGFGKGGKTLAGKLAALGKKVAMIEKSDQMYGGTCINVGCIPSKSLVRSAGLSHLAEEASFAEKAERYALAIAEKRRLTGLMRKKNFDKLKSLANVTIYNGTASFLSDTRVRVAMAGGETLELLSEKIFINTGSTPVIPPIKGIGENPFVYFSDTMMELEQLPRRLAIVGGGYIGMEFASMYQNFGSQVTVIQDGERFLPREDEDMAEAIRRELETRGITFLAGAAIREITGAGDHAEIFYTRQGEEQKLAADAVLVATGRRPNTDGLNAKAAGVELSPRGAVKVDEGLRTAARNIWAMGDVTGGLQFTYVSLDDFRVVWSQLTGGDYTTDKRRNVPYSVFLDPAFSRVGMNEQEALKAGKEIKILKLPAAAIPKAQVLRNPAGLLKAVIDRQTNQILGAMLFCEQSYEMINIIKLCMDLGAEYTVLGRQIFTHPTMSEALNDLFSD